MTFNKNSLPQLRIVQVPIVSSGKAGKVLEQSEFPQHILCCLSGKFPLTGHVVHIFYKNYFPFISTGCFCLVHNPGLTIFIIRCFKAATLFSGGLNGFASNSAFPVPWLC